MLPAAANAGPVPSLNFGGAVQLNFQPVTDSNNNVIGLNYTEMTGSITASAPSVVVPISINPFVLGKPQVWNDILIWNSPILPIVNGWTYATVGCDVLCGDISLSTVNDAYSAADALFNAGPTQRFITVPLGSITSSYLPRGSIGLGAGMTFKWDVTIPKNANVVMDQPAHLHQLTIGSGGILTGNPGMSVDTNLVNDGFISDLGGTVQNNFVNSGTVLIANANGNGLHLQGALTNTGEIDLSSVLVINQSVANSGLITIEGGSLVTSKHFTNFGTFKMLSRRIVPPAAGLAQTAIPSLTNYGRFVWSGGDIYATTITNASKDFTIETGTGTKKGLAPDGPHGATMTNTGTITQVGTAVLGLYGSTQYRATLDNEAGALYDLKGDGSLTGDDYAGPRGNFFNNAEIGRAHV